MAYDQTEQQSHQQQRHAQELSRKRSRPPTDVPGYEPERFLGAGAYGEVWLAVDQNTGRHVAIKFYLHRGGLDWALLSREVEKLVFLSADRYIVQLLDVGWDADPPYYVMEYIENGSLDDLLRERATLPIDRAVELFREVAVGLVHAHGKGVLHCDLKPANVLLDQDHKPRLADFGQSRLSDEQTPALGTLYYMAPEQADLQAVPDACWDVYALGALLYCMLTGEPPHRSEETTTKIDSTTDLADRLACYREAIRSAPPLSAHRRVRGIDRALVEIVDRCLAPEARFRFANVQGVLDALGARDRHRARRPLVVLGFVGPALLLAVMILFGWRGYREAVHKTEADMQMLSFQSNGWAATSVAATVANEIDRYYRAVQDVADDPEFQRLVQATLEHEKLAGMIERLDREQADNELRETFEGHAARLELQRYLVGLMNDLEQPKTASWFVCNAAGTQLAAVFDAPSAATIGHNYAWRSYFHGRFDDLPRNERPPPGEHIGETHLSAAFESTATRAWKVAVSTPIEKDGDFLGIVALAMELGHIVRKHKFEGIQQQFAVLVDGRQGRHRGVILQHPLFDRLLDKNNVLPSELSHSKYYVSLNGHPSGDTEQVHTYHDPLGDAPGGEAYRRKWIAAEAPVLLDQSRRGEDGQPMTEDSGLIVLVQQDNAAVTQPVRQMGQKLVREGVMALLVVVVVVMALWSFVVRVLGGSTRLVKSAPGNRSTSTSGQGVTTLPLPPASQHRL